MKKYRVDLHYGKIDYSCWGFTDVLVGDNDNLTDLQIINMANEQFKRNCNSRRPSELPFKKAVITDRAEVA